MYNTIKYIYYIYLARYPLIQYCNTYSSIVPRVACYSSTTGTRVCTGMYVYTYVYVHVFLMSGYQCINMAIYITGSCYAMPWQQLNGNTESGVWGGLGRSGVALCRFTSFILSFCHFVILYFYLQIACYPASRVAAIAMDCNTVLEYRQHASMQAS